MRPLFYKPRHLAPRPPKPSILAISPIVRRSLVGGGLGVAMVLGGTAMGPSVRPYQAEAQPLIKLPVKSPVRSTTTTTTTTTTEIKNNNPSPPEDRRRVRTTTTREAARQEMAHVLATATTQNKERDGSLPPVTTLPQPKPIDPPVVVEPEPSEDRVKPQPEHGQVPEENQDQGEHLGWTDPQPEHGQDTDHHKNSPTTTIPE
jgi:hypothetical protein